MTRVYGLTIFVIVSFSLFVILTPVMQTFAQATNIIEVTDVGFGFGWSANAGDKWLVNGESLILNGEALVTVPSTAISGDAGSSQTNPSSIYLNNVGFSFGWSNSGSEKYRPSDSMSVGASQILNSRAPVQPATNIIDGDAGAAQQNQILIYFNKIGFSFGWSSETDDKYSPSATTAVGSATSLNNHGLLPFSDTPESPGPDRFSPTTDGFSFSNNEFTDKIKRPIQEVREQFSSSSLAAEIPQYQRAVFEYLLQAIEWTQMGYCGGMVRTAQQYYESPSLLPSGYSQTCDIPITEASTNALIIANQWSQLLDGQGIFKWLLLRLGDGSTGLVPSGEEIDWILEQLDQNETVRLTLFDQSLGWLLSHAVLAYDYEESGNDVYLKVYGPNMGTYEQEIHLVRRTAGNYDIYGGEQYVDGLWIYKLGSQEAPTWGWSVLDLMPNFPEIISNILSYILEESYLLFKIESPADLLITSPTALSVGYDSETQMVVNEIEGAMYSGPGTEPQLIIIPTPIQGDYLIETFGTGDGNYTITVESATTSYPEANTTSWTGTTTQGKLDTFTIELTEDYSVIPEIPSWTLLTLFSTITVIVVVVKRRLKLTPTEF